MSPWILAFLFIVWVGAIIFLRVNRIWLLYYIAGAVGIAYWIVYIARFVYPIEQPLAHSVAWIVNLISNQIGMRGLRVFECLILFSEKRESGKREYRSSFPAIYLPELAF